MSTFGELVYMVLDELKIQSDDAHFEEEHVIFLLSKYRSFLLKQRYSNIKKEVPDSNNQTICLDLELTDAIDGSDCEGGAYLRSTTKIPYTLGITNPRVSSLDLFSGTITFIDRNRFRYIGYNKWLNNIIYCTIGPDRYLYLKSNNPQYAYLEKIVVTGVFNDIQEAFELRCENEDEICEINEMSFPIEDALIPPLIELVVRELSGAIYRPKDKDNNSKDDLSEISNE